MAIMLGNKGKEMAKISLNPRALNPVTYKKTVRHKIPKSGEGEGVFRILPPFNDEAEGYPYYRWSIVWGLNDPTSGRMRPYASPFSSREENCPVYDYLTLLKDKVERLKGELIAQGLDEEEIKTRLNDYNQIISDLRPKTIYAYNAVDKAGQVGLLELKKTAHEKLISLMNGYLSDYEQDPTSLSGTDEDSGVWFKFHRSGLGFDTKYFVDKSQVKQKNGGVLSFIDDRSPLSESVVSNYSTLGYDLATVYQKFGYDELKEILVANLINISSKIPGILFPGFGLEDASSSPSQVTSTPARVSSNKLVRPAFSAGTDGDDEEEEYTPPAKTAAPVKTASKTSVTSVSDSSTDDLMKLADDIFNSSN